MSRASSTSLPKGCDSIPQRMLVLAQVLPASSGKDSGGLLPPRDAGARALAPRQKAAALPLGVTTPDPERPHFCRGPTRAAVCATPFQGSAGQMTPHKDPGAAARGEAEPTGRSTDPLLVRQPSTAPRPGRARPQRARTRRASLLHSQRNQ